MTAPHRARKRFGQHFLTHATTIERIVAAVAPQAADTLVEIGPGEGAITVPLASCCRRLHALEYDRDLVARLRARFADDARVTIHQADALRFDYATLGNPPGDAADERLRIVGNLPYNISTPLLFRMVEVRHLLRDLHFMLQKEVVDRMTAAPGGRDYGRLTIMLGVHMQATPLFDVPPEAFRPPPRVTSTVVRLQPRPPGVFGLHDHGGLSALVTAAFGKRRKTLRNALKGLVGEDELRDCGIDPAARPEQIAIPAWIELANRRAAGP